MPTVYLDNPPPRYRDQSRSIVKRAPSGIKSYFTGMFPIVHWLPKYNLTWLASDIICAITVGAVVIPQSMAYGEFPFFFCLFDNDRPADLVILLCHLQPKWRIFLRSMVYTLALSVLLSILSWELQRISA